MVGINPTPTQVQLPAPAKPEAVNNIVPCKVTPATAPAVAAAPAREAAASIAK